MRMHTSMFVPTEVLLMIGRKEKICIMCTNYNSTKWGPAPFWCLQIPAISFQDPYECHKILLAKDQSTKKKINLNSGTRNELEELL